MTLLTSWVVLFLFLIPGSTTVGLVVNVVLIKAVRTKQSLTTTDIIFVSLAVSDFMYSLFCLLGCVPRYIQYFDEDKGADAMVSLMPVFFQFIYGIPNSIGKFLTTLLSLERAVAVFWPSYFRSQWTKRQVLFTIVFGTAVVVLAAVPLSLRLKAALKEDITNSTSPGTMETQYTDLYSNNLNLFRLYNTIYQAIFGIFPIVAVLVLTVATLFGLFRMERKIGLLRRHQPNRVSVNGPQGQFIPSITQVANMSEEAMAIEVENGDATYIDHSVKTTVEHLGRHDDYEAGGKRELGITRDGSAFFKSSFNGVVVKHTQRSDSDRDASASNSNIDDENKSPHYPLHPCKPTINLINITRESTGRVDSRYAFNNLRYFKRLPPISKTKNKVQGWSKEQKHRSVTLIMIASVFLLSNLPSKILFAVVQNNSRATFKEKASLQLDVYIGIVIFCEILNTIFNSMIFVIRSNKYRHYVYDKWRCCAKQRDTIVI